MSNHYRIVHTRFAESNQRSIVNEVSGSFLEVDAVKFYRIRVNNLTGACIHFLGDHCQISRSYAEQCCAIDNDGQSYFLKPRYSLRIQCQVFLKNSENKEGLYNQMYGSAWSERILLSHTNSSHHKVPRQYAHFRFATFSRVSYSIFLDTESDGGCPIGVYGSNTKVNHIIAGRNNFSYGLFVVHTAVNSVECTDSTFFSNKETGDLTKYFAAFDSTVYTIAMTNQIKFIRCKIDDSRIQFSGLSITNALQTSTSIFNCVTNNHYVRDFSLSFIALDFLALIYHENN